MTTKKRRKITPVQIKALMRKLIVLRRKRDQIVRRTTPLRATLRVFIQQNMKALEAHVTPPRIEHNKIRWAMDKVKHGYFGDATLKDLVEIAHFLDVVKWEGSK